MHLLAATDFSEHAAFALERAATLASLHPDAALTLMHVYAAEGLEVVRQMFRSEVEEAERTIVAEAEGRLRSLASQCVQTAGHKVETLLAQGRPAARIVATADELAADLVVMGDRGGSAVRSAFLGSTVESVLQRSKRSVLAVKQPVSGPYRRLLVGVSSWDDAAEAAELAFLWNPGAELILLHAFEAPAEEKFRRAGAVDDWIKEYRVQSRRVAETEMERLGARLDSAGIRARRIVVQGAPAAAILEHGQRLSADLVVVGKHRSSVLGSLFFDDIARQVAVESSVDVLVAASLPNR